MASGSRRLKQQQLDAAVVAAEGMPEFPTGKVTSTSPFTVLYNGASLQMRRLAAYTPSNGDITMLVRSGGKWIALGPTV
jgi:hypothetical protein